jgi:hypothetical protein
MDFYVAARSKIKFDYVYDFNNNCVPDAQISPRVWHNFRSVYMNKIIVKTEASANVCSAMERETISKNRVSSRKTVNSMGNFFRKEELL